jgi:PAS domain-containing protein
VTDLLDADQRRVFGEPTDSIQEVARRAAEVYPDQDVIVWEGDAQTFQFTYVNDAAERVLGWPASRWTGEPTFWADAVLHPDDRDEAIAYCALATGRRANHMFEYRAQTRSGEMKRLRDVVVVVVGPRRVATRLRGLMFDLSGEASDEGAAPGVRRLRPSIAHLEGLE